MAKKPKTSMKDQRPAPGPRTLDATMKAVRSNLERPFRVAVDLEQGEGGALLCKSPHTAEEAHARFLYETFGTASPSFGSDALSIIEMATRDRHAEPGESLGKVNAALAFIGALEPRDEVEGALAIQMACNHALATEMLWRAKSSSALDHVMQFGNMAVKLQRTFTAQIEALARMRGGANQSVRVEHVHVHEGGQAIVGNVASDGGRGRGRASAKGQSHAQPENDGSAPMLGQDPEGNGVPIASGERAPAVPDARRN